MWKLFCNKENMRTFINALRCGGYEQGFGRLTHTEELPRALWQSLLGIKPVKTTYCALGVAYHLANQSRGRTGLSTSMTLCRWLGVGNGKDIPLNAPYYSVIYANDQLKASFEEIADALEEMYL